ncbi:phenylalanine--tRNA ligase subunit beta [Floricoccus penangensis]|uniref:Phenylalanine--tRNA ligase beta subunit n=1 Tax=Floricoccus penangensis TaxID=1859475 RepID=A0A9Q5P0A3_9LACT|nr:phenylalanine--tRNA ligase subunit beta [Floricoccus penangensis]OFI47562.1 phenylalanine--tRNA ligase subunit beta [Floricoccus penangensis]
MLVSYKWLKEYVDIDVPAADLAEKMSTSGIEVEGVESRQDGLKSIVVGEVVSCEDIPETHLHLCQVNTGDAEPRQIVCGAPNVKEGIKVIVALPGARIAGNYKIKKGKMRGYESLGMICSLGELGFPDSVVPKEYADGIYIMPSDAKVGDDVFKYIGMDDEVLELSITPNRADALSMRGVAHEVAAIYDKKVNFPSVELKEEDKKTSDEIAVQVDSAKSKTYKSRIIEDVKVGPSPLWLQNLLMNIGVRPISNVVDVTNYILMYFGQPMHAFDLDTFKERKILVRDARDGEKLTTLDDVERDLTSDDLVITVADKPVALAGVMGGLDTEITEKSTNVVLEAALFDGASIRKTSQKFNLRSESSARFEKGINEADVTLALDTAAAMIAELAGGKVLNGVVESNDYKPQSVDVAITLTKINSSLGTDLTIDQVVAIFDQLGFETSVDGENLVVTIPPRRWDITIEADLVEEVARIYGYDNLPSTLPNAGNTIGELTPMQKLRRDTRTVLEGAGLTEVISYALTTPEKASQFTKVSTELVSLAMPMSEERQTLRNSIIPGMLDIVNYNMARGNSELAIYEVGNVFIKFGNEEDGRPTELPQVAMAFTGNTDFYQAKGVVETLLQDMDLRFEKETKLEDMHPGRTARVIVSGKEIGFVGQVHPAVAKAYDIPTTYVASLDLTGILENKPEQVVFTEIPKFPAVKRDLALLVNRDTENQEVLDIIDSAKVKLLKNVSIFDVYTGENVPTDKKSLAYSLTFQNPEQTLTDEEINSAMNKIVKKLNEAGFEVR